MRRMVLSVLGGVAAATSETASLESVLRIGLQFHTDGEEMVVNGVLEGHDANTTCVAMLGGSSGSLPRNSTEVLKMAAELQALKLAAELQAKDASGGGAHGASEKVPSMDVFEGPMEVAIGCSVKVEKDCSGECSWDPEKMICGVDAGVAFKEFLGDNGVSPLKEAAGSATGTDNDEPMVQLMKKSMTCKVKEEAACIGECEWSQEHGRCDVGPFTAIQVMTGVTATSESDEAADSDADEDLLGALMKRTMACQVMESEDCGGSCEWDEDKGYCHLSPMAALALMKPDLSLLGGRTATTKAPPRRRLIGEPAKAVLGVVDEAGAIVFKGLVPKQLYTPVCVVYKPSLAEDGNPEGVQDDNPDGVQDSNRESIQDGNPEGVREVAVVGFASQVGLKLFAACGFIVGVLACWVLVVLPRRNKRAPRWRSSDGNAAESELMAAAPSNEAFVSAAQADTGMDWTPLT